MKISYYPGCPLHSTGKEYGESTRAVCQANLEMRQNGANMPVLYFTEVLGMALGMRDVSSWLKQHITGYRLPVTGYHLPVIGDMIEE